MSFSKDVVLSLAILGVVLESDLGHKKIGWFRVARPIIVAAVIVPIYFTNLPTAGNDLALQAIGAALGILLGLTAVSPLVMFVGFDPDYRGWWARTRHRPGHPATVTIAGGGYALIWIAATLARLLFAYGSQHWFPHAISTFLSTHQLAPAALTNALIFLPVAMDVFRSLGLLTRKTTATRGHQVTTGISHTR